MTTEIQAESTMGKVATEKHAVQYIEKYLYNINTLKKIKTSINGKSFTLSTVQINKQEFSRFSTMFSLV